MTVSTTANVVSYISGGPTFPITYRFLKDADIKARLVMPDGTTVSLTTAQYSLAGAGAATGGTLTSTYAATILAAGGARLVISREISPTQEVDLRNQGAYYAETQEVALDKLTMLAQQALNGNDRVVSFPISDPAGLTQILPSTTGRAGRVLAFGSDGGVVVSNLTLESIEQQPAGAAASAQAAAASATNAAGSAASSTQSAADAAASKTNADASAALAQKWAANPVDVPVSSGQFSAYHWASKAAGVVGGLDGRVTALESIPRGLGDGQSWQNFTASRAKDTTYTNTSGRPIMVSVIGVAPANSVGAMSAVVAGITIGTSNVSESGYTQFNQFTATLSFVVPNNATYRVSTATGTLTLPTWTELR